MLKRKPFLLGVTVVAIAAVIAGGVFAGRGLHPSVVEVKAGAAPTASDRVAGIRIAGTSPIDGQPVSIAQFAGKPVVLNVWASWCKPCNEEAAALRRFGERHPNVVVLGIDNQDTAAGAKAFYRRWSWTHPSLADPKSTIAHKLGVRGMPTTIFLNARHQVIAFVRGAATSTQLESGYRLATGRTK